MNTPVLTMSSAKQELADNSLSKALAEQQKELLEQVRQELQQQLQKLTPVPVPPNFQWSSELLAVVKDVATGCGISTAGAFIVNHISAGVPYHPWLGSVLALTGVGVGAMSIWNFVTKLKNSNKSYGFAVMFAMLSAPILVVPFVTALRLAFGE